MALSAQVIASGWRSASKALSAASKAHKGASAVPACQASAKASEAPR